VHSAASDADLSAGPLFAAYASGSELRPDLRHPRTPPHRKCAVSAHCTNQYLDSRLAVAPGRPGLATHPVRRAVCRHIWASSLSALRRGRDRRARAMRRRLSWLGTKPGYGPNAGHAGIGPGVAVAWS